MAEKRQEVGMREFWIDENEPIDVLYVDGPANQPSAWVLGCDEDLDVRSWEDGDEFVDTLLDLVMERARRRADRRR
jgi:hypothetical protein